MIKTIAVGNMGVNCYLVCDGEKTVVIDPGDDFEKIKSLAGGKIDAVLLTHGHFDHIGAVASLQKEGARVYVSQEDADMLFDNKKCLGAFAGVFIKPSNADCQVDDGDEIIVGKMKFSVILTPGHTKGSVCYKFEDVLFSGDTLFCGSVGRWDFPGGDFEALIKSIKEKIFVLDGNTRVLPGHGDESTVKQEKTFNPFVR